MGLELRPRRLREAAAFWQAITDAVGATRRDELWAHPDLLPSSDDIDDPQRVIASLTGESAEPDDVDRALSDLLADDSGDRPIEGNPGEGAPGEEPSGPDDDEDSPRA